jgi:hypothetical protein
MEQPINTYNQDQGDIIRIQVEEPVVETPVEEEPAEEIVEVPVEEIPAEPVKKKK